MAESIKILNLDVSAEQSYIYLKCKQYDQNSRIYQLIITDRHIPLQLKGNEVIIAAMTRSDGTYTDTICTWDNGKLYLTMTDAMLAISGQARCEVRIYDSQQLSVLSTLNFHIDIVPSTIPMDRILKSDEFNALNELILSMPYTIKEIQEIIDNLDIGDLIAISKTQPTDQKIGNYWLVESLDGKVKQIGKKISNNGSISDYRMLSIGAEDKPGDVYVDFSGEIVTVIPSGGGTNGGTGTGTGGEVNVIERIQLNGTTLPVSNKTVNISNVATQDYVDEAVSNITDSSFLPAIPAKTSELINDSGFITDENYIHTDNNFTTELKQKLAGISEGANKIIVDAEMSDTSDNPVQNKVIKKYIDDYLDANFGEIADVIDNVNRTVI